MGQEQSSTMNTAQGPHKSCRPCGDWGKKDLGTVKVDAAALHALGKENTAHPNVASSATVKADAMSQESQEQEKARQRREWEAKQEELRRQEEERKEMERRVREEQERQQAELRRREAEKRRLQLEQEAREREELEHQEKQRRAQEEQIAEQLRQEERDRALFEQRKADQKKMNAWLQLNKFKGPNDLVRKGLSKVTPLQCAIQQKNVEMTMLLLQNGADENKASSKNESALVVAQKMDKKGSHSAIVQALQSRGK